MVRKKVKTKLNPNTKPSLLNSEERLPQNFSPYACEWGEDDYGVYQIIALFETEHLFRWIPPGVFLMGSPESEKGRFEGEIQHKVTISQGFWLGETTVTQGQWMSDGLNNENPSVLQGGENPVENISWDDCLAFIVKLNSRYPELAARLPTEAEWEYACRAGSVTSFYWGDELNLEKANYNGYWGEFKFTELALQKTCIVKQFKPNVWGLYQMHGNVFEWCHDVYKEYSTDEVIDPEGPVEGTNRVLRGGAWNSRGRDLRSAYRRRGARVFRRYYVGFRLALGRELQSGGAAYAGEDAAEQRQKRELGKP